MHFLLILLYVLLIFFQTLLPTYVQYKFNIYTRKNRPYPFNLKQIHEQVKVHYWLAEIFVDKLNFYLMYLAKLWRPVLREFTSMVISSSYEKCIARKNKK